MNKKIIRITTVPISLRYLLAGQLNYFQQKGFDVLMISADGDDLAYAIEKENCKHQIVPMTRKITPFQDLKCLIQLIKIFKREKPDIVHSMTPKAGLLGMLAARFCGVKVRVHDVVGMPLMVESGPKLTLLKFIEKITYKAANHVWPNSVSLYTFILEHNLCAKHKLKIIANGSTNGINVEDYMINDLTNEEIVHIKETIDYDEKNIYLLFIGRQVKDKGIIELINVFKQLSANNQNIRLILVGKFENDLDPLPQNILDEIAHNKYIYNIKWVKHVKHVMAVSNIFVFPSYREGLPVVLLEAAAMKLPIICSNIPGNIDIVMNQNLGLTFNVKNETELYQQINFALKNNSILQQMALELYNHVKINYNQNSLWEAILNEYKSNKNKL